ncbi:magnesium-transporting ATPase (P-type) [Arcicella sp. BE140]|nr:magnesium-transporting ATPase (P-type) [Arcicella sp. BE51]MDR6814416.1 magnesium-transporting ATPase (P-type) [Arcicella sp. BE140]MDR6825828.1 magnesium-transporting ATPase (P-type) [Arcicella sp. BE139]
MIYIFITTLVVFICWTFSFYHWKSIQKRNHFWISFSFYVGFAICLFVIIWNTYIYLKNENGKSFTIGVYLFELFLLECSIGFTLFSWILKKISRLA